MSVRSSLRSRSSARAIRRIAILTSLATASVVIPSVSQVAAVDDPSLGVFISEIHYDNTGGDVGEAVEVFGPAGTDLTGWTVVRYNGNGGAVYGTDTLTETIPDLDGTSGVVVVDYPANGLQNGSPDGVALVDSAGVVQQFLSYEGSFTAADGPAAGLTSTDIGVTEPNDTAIGDSLQLVGTGITNGDFTWQAPAPSSFGAINGDGGGGGGDPFISEIHYDNAGADVGEGVEITGPAGTDLTGWTVVPYNGNGGGQYSAVALTATIPDEADGLGAVEVPIVGLQNGSPDGVALVAPDGSLVEFLSYEGSFEATDGAALGVTSTDIGVSETGSTPVGESLQLIDGIWTGPAAASFGAINGAPPPTRECDVEILTLISAVQGPGDASPLVGQAVTVEAAITAIYPDLGGITVQEEPTDVDGDPATSEGVFVFLGFGFDESAYSAGSIVQVTGAVEERFGNTQIAGDAVVCDVAPVAIDPTPLTLPADAATRESLEGMLVVTTQDLTVTGLFTAYRFGELGVAPEGVLEQPSDRFEPGSAAALELEAANADALLYIDDRDEFGNDNDPWFGDPGERAGDVVESGAVGVIYFSFGDYLFEPVGAFPEIVSGAPAFADREPAPALDGGNDIGAFNVLNYFNTFGDSAVLRGATSQAEFDIQSAKIVDAVVSLDAAVLGLIEIENDYEDEYDGDPSTVPSIQTLVDELNAVAGSGTYDWVRIPEALLTSEGLGGGGLGTDAIAVGIVYQPARATLIGDAATFDIDELLGGEDPDNNRWPLAASFDIDGKDVTVIVNHFKSKGSTCDDTIVPAGVGDGVDDPQTGSCDLVREYAAERVITWSKTKPTGVNSPDTFVVGDLNSYAQEDPIEAFREAGWADLIEEEDDDAFTYKFDGRFGRLDYLLASPSAKRLVDDAEVWQANSPEPYGYLYSNEPIDLSAYASSDHDPIVASISKPGRGPRR